MDYHPTEVMKMLIIRYGEVPNTQSIVSAFDNSVASRKYQDVGYDGLYDSLERIHFSDYLATVKGLSADAYTAIANDPSADNYHYFRGSKYDNDNIKILERYKYFNNTEGNSPTDDDNPENILRNPHLIPIWKTSTTTIP